MVTLSASSCSDSEDVADNKIKLKVANNKRAKAKWIEVKQRHLIVAKSWKLHLGKIDYQEPVCGMREKRRTLRGGFRLAFIVSNRSHYCKSILKLVFFNETAINNRGTPVRH